MRAIYRIGDRVLILGYHNRILERIIIGRSDFFENVGYVLNDGTHVNQSDIIGKV